MDPHNIAREFFPNFSDPQCENVLWGKTSFPYFDTQYSVESIHNKCRQELRKYKIATEKELDICNFCLEEKEVIGIICRDCRDRLTEKQRKLDSAKSNSGHQIKRR